MVVAAAARHGVRAVFQRGVPACCIDNGLEGLGRQRAASYVRVDDNAGSVHYGAQRRLRKGEHAHGSALGYLLWQ